jgi:hypothetical protein
MDFRLFKRPPESSKDALDIWIECKLCYMEYYFRIRDKLWDWCHAEKERITQRGKHYYVHWVSKSGVRMEAKWEAFFNWMLCACEEQKIDTTDKLGKPILQPIVEDIPEKDGVSYIVLENFSTIEGFFSDGI